VPGMPRGPVPAPPETQRERHRQDQGDRGLRPTEVRGEMLGPEQAGRPVHGWRVAPSRPPERREQREIHVRGSNEHALAARREPSGGKCDQNVGEHRDRSVHRREPEPACERRANLARHRTREPHEPERGHEDAERVLLLPPPDQQAARQKRPADRQRQGRGEPGIGHVAVPRDQEEGHDAERGAQRPNDEPGVAASRATPIMRKARGRHGRRGGWQGHLDEGLPSRILASAAPLMSAFVMNP
jgi:hypothetical protein